MADAWVKRGHRVERLHHVRAALTGLREERLEVHLAVHTVAFQRLDAYDVVLTQFRRMLADVQQGEH